MSVMVLIGSDYIALGIVQAHKQQSFLPACSPASSVPAPLMITPVMNTVRQPTKTM